MPEKKIYNKIEMSLEHQEMLKSIGDKVKELRSKTGDSYEVFAFKNNINRISQYRLEKGENFNMSTLLKVLKGLDIKMNEFFIQID